MGQTVELELYLYKMESYDCFCAYYYYIWKHVKYIHACDMHNVMHAIIQ